MATKKKGGAGADGTPPATPTKRAPKQPNKFQSPVGKVILNAGSIVAGLAAKNNFSGLDMSEVKAKKSEDLEKNKKNVIVGKLNFDLNGNPKGSVARTLAGSEDSEDFKKFRALAKAASPFTSWNEATIEFTKAIMGGGASAGRASRVLSPDDLGML